MSWLYRVFGIPGTKDEFLDKVNGQNKKVTITVGCYSDPLSFNYNYFIELNVGHVSFVTEDFSVGKFDPLVDEKLKHLESDLLKQAKGIQDQLTQMGLESILLSVTGEAIPAEHHHMQYDGGPALAPA